MKKYVFKPYSPSFPKLFRYEKERITTSVHSILAIEHVGSTAVPELGGKGIIDIAIAVKKKDMASVCNELQAIGYEYRANFSTPDRYYLIADLPDLKERRRRYHVHLTYLESQDWNNLIHFRDYLRNDPEVRQEYAECKKHAANEANHDGKRYRELKDPIFKKVRRLHTIRFEKASLKYYEIIEQWLQEPHVQEFWDTSPEHRQDILIFMKGRNEPSPYWGGIFDYWIGFIEDVPYCLLMTSEIFSSETDLPEMWRAHLSKTGKTFGLDFMIGNRNFLGQGLAGSTLDKFTRYIHMTVPSCDTFFIDPAETNPRAKHVYEKAGFIKVGTFQRNHVHHILMVRTI